MIRYETYCRIRQHAQDGLSHAQIAEALNLSRNTVARWATAKNFLPRQTAVRTSKLDPYKDYIQRLLEKHEYSAVQLLDRLKEQGYQGSYSILKRYVHKVRPAPREAYLTLSFPPGECAQVDWGEWGTVTCGSTNRRLSFFVMVLCYSRLMYLEFTVLQTMEHFLQCHLNGFRFFGGVPSRIMVDNLKSAVLHRMIGRAPVFNPRYLDFATTVGFSISACNPRKGNEKGRVENGVGYVKKNLLRGLEASDLPAVKLAATRWLTETANVRLHAETRQRPCDLFQKEQHLLSPLPPDGYDIGTISTVRASTRFRVTVDTNRYSVPATYAGKLLTLKTYPDRLVLYDGTCLVTSHPRSYDRHQDFENPDHVAPLLEQRQKAKQSQTYKAFLAISPRADEYYQRLVQKRLNPRHHVEKIVALAELHGADVVKDAMNSAFLLHAFSSDYIANLIDARSRLAPQRAELHLTKAHALLAIEIEAPDLSIYDRSTHDDRSPE